MLINDLRKRFLKEITTTLAELAGQNAAEIPDPAKMDFQAIALSEPKNRSFGDLTTNAAMVLAPILKKNPLQIAEMLSKKIIEKWAESANISIAPPGFINFTLNPDYLARELAVISQNTGNYGQNSNGVGIKIQVEFVSANPTGSLHIGHGRWAALGDSLSNIFAANGYEVSREYYVNDFGSQIAKFARCLASLYLKAFGKSMPYPEDGYPEELVIAVVEEIISEKGDSCLVVQPAAYEIDIDAIGRMGIAIMVKKIEATLASMGVAFDNWFYESSLHKDSNFEKTIEALKKKGIIYEKDNALWFKASDFGDEKDRVVIRTGGEPTYFASDIMYLINKTERGFDRLIYILGADHHGYIKRLHAIGRATGFDDANIEVIIGQLVHLIENGQAVKMSKRKGKVYNLDDLIEEVGSDAIRYFFCANSFDTPMDFDLDLAKQKSNQNPVYYVQYAHARIANVIEKVKRLCASGELRFNEKELKLPEQWRPESTISTDEYAQPAGDTFDKNPPGNSTRIFEETIDFFISNNRFDDIKLANEDENGLAKILLLYPDIVNDACVNEAPYMINQYLYRLASQFHYFYKHHRVIDEGKLNTSRFKLILLARVVLSNAMRILKVSTPVKM